MTKQLYISIIYITCNTAKGGIFMNTISLRMNDEDAKLLREYVSVNKLNMSQFVRELIMDKLEEEFALDEERILKAHLKAKEENKYDHTEIWEILGV